ncbi:MAG: AAA family ATPase, partial [Chroococcales cyanobacterium]
MLEKIELYNFKSHRNTQLSLDNSRLHALVGQNSSGKTSVLEALHYLSRLADSPFKTIFTYQRSPEFLATMGQTRMAVSASGFWGYYPRKNWEVSYEFEKTHHNSWSPTASWKVDNHEKQSIESWSNSLNEASEPIPQALRYAVHLKLVATNL